MLDTDTLTEIIELQRDWISRLPEGIKREKFNEINLSPKFALIISGIRRCGKSTLLNQILKNQENFYYLNLEDPRMEGFGLKDFNKCEEIFRNKYGENGIYFFDEIQNIPRWEIFIRYLVDKNNKVVITGSNASLLSKELGTRLTGRHIDITLFPFSFKEFLKYLNLKPSLNTFNRFLFDGGFPEFLKERNPLVLNELINDVVMRDIVNRFGIRNSSLLKKIAIFLISNVGKEFSYNSIKKTFQIKSVQTVIDYISHFEDSYILFTIPRFSYSYKQQQVNNKKVYSIDNGFSLNNSVSFSKDKGRMLENSVFLELKRRYKEIFYFQEKNECDFVYKNKNGKMQAIQVCYNLNEENQDREINGLVEAMNKFKLTRSLIITMDQEDNLEIENKKIMLKPAWKWLLDKNSE
ncbi:AAA family ATPase [Candidatus Pacearchaeota archaeon]|jgi:hypothetical protein|nr:AAA family ATPase [Candidatus Pacearchaeota archaeon]|tara:strand:- start:51 stop:1274 length:1224 start_codon:yes stop_codon:yes gene_type:complete